MKAVEKYIKEHTRNIITIIVMNKTPMPWLTINDTRRVAEIAREETIKEVCEWLYNHNDYICGGTNGITMYDMDKLIEDLKKHLEGKK